MKCVSRLSRDNLVKENLIMTQCGLTVVILFSNWSKYTTSHFQQHRISTNTLAYTEHWQNHVTYNALYSSFFRNTFCTFTDILTAWYSRHLNAFISWWALAACCLAHDDAIEHALHFSTQQMPWKDSQIVAQNSNATSPKTQNAFLSFSEKLQQTNILYRFFSLGCVLAVLAVYVWRL